MEWLILFILFPLFVTITPSRSLLFLLFFIPFFIRYFRGGTLLPATPYNFLLFGLLGMILVSLLATYSVSLSLRKVSMLVWGLVLFWSLQDSLQSSKQNKFWLLSSLTGLGFCVSIISLFNPSISLKIPGGNSIFGFLSKLPSASLLMDINPNEIGGILSWCIPISFSFFCLLIRKKINFNVEGIFKERFLSFLMICPLFPMLIILLVSSSRSALTGTIFAIGMISWLMSEVRMRKILFIIFLFLISIIVSALFVDSLQLILLNLLDILTGKSSQNINGIGSINVRVEIWSRALYGIQDFPFTGMGMNTFREVVHSLYPLFLISQEVDIAHAHNQFLQTALDLGIPGLIFYLGIWIMSIVLLVKSWGLSIDDLEHRALIAGILGSLLASFTFSLTDAIALGAIPSFGFWILMALISSQYSEFSRKKSIFAKQKALMM